ncbi:Putative transposase of IS4/5 family [Novosphingobium mathurense]|uniref:Putative transposase of IS4/5 family n=1 Tax=Novosphingobium mathurense TaxID=428990 RepID=A0A1U6IMA2_9SPHN|nr:Putative transposase of IS4/5 family [Novosphingobium mathurense]
MAWTGIAREEHSRKGLRYPSDMTDREWLLLAPFIPPAKQGGRRRSTDLREVANALLYLASAGCAWRLLPKCFPPVSTVRRCFYAWPKFYSGLEHVRNTGRESRRNPWPSARSCLRCTENMRLVLAALS